ncbi:VWA domain-containing protein [Gordonia crocea]|uniref:Uncharacterized protein n=1 Tax=Gordonia crocea TaxID=589162 RepID=A0A7I9V347_9ACTN|nr:VWA domain-containing protein [Gordonia crocea]GED99469.1 hypothetical protein nbrc107697_35080 [Gordonia crocea]
MATYVLDGKSAATLARRPLAVRLAVSGTPTTGGVRLVARTPDGQPSTAVVETAPTMLILPHVTDEIVIGAVPQGGDLFAPGTTVHVSIGPDSNTEFDADVAQLTPRDVSGLGFIKLASVAPGGADTVTVTTWLTRPDSKLPPVAEAARVAARGVLNVDQVHESRALPVRLVVDASASMAPLFASGMVAAAADLVAGLAEVVSGSSQITLGAIGPSAPPPVPTATDGAGAALAAGPSIGYGLSGGPAVPAAPGTLTVVLTDSVPADPITADQVVLVLSGARPTTAVRGSVLAPVDNPVAALTAAPTVVTRVVSELLAPFSLAGGAR